MSQIKILFGGAFNPPTIAHYKIAEELLNRLDCTITFLPTNNYYNKGQTLVDFKNRYEMLDIMVKKLPKPTNISTFEKDQVEYKGTYETLKFFFDYYFLIGYDQFCTLTTWINAKKLIEENKFIVIPREGYNIDETLKNELIKENLKNFIFLNDFPIYPISSTMFRESFKKELVDDEVYQYIKKYNLYEVK